MSKLKKTAVAVLALGSSAVFAGTMGPVCAPGNVTIPCERTAWEFGGQALYLQPTTTGDLGYVNPVVTAGVGTAYNTVEPRWGWGFKLEGAYRFSTGNDLNLNWYHFNNTTSRLWTPGGAFLGGYVVEPKWDAVNLELGQHVDFSDMKYLRLHGGVQWARVDNRVLSNHPVGELRSNATYNGFGPRFGGDMTYDIGNGFSIYGNGAGALLIGTGKHNVTNLTAGVTPDVLAASTLSYSRTTMVPELEGKLGAKYNFSMAQGDLGLDVGYMWVNYFNAVNHGRVVPAVPALPVVHSDDFALNGLYFGLKWVGNV